MRSLGRYESRSIRCAVMDKKAAARWDGIFSASVYQVLRLEPTKKAKAHFAPTRRHRNLYAF